MKNQALTTKKSSVTSSNSGANKIRRSNSKKVGSKKARASGSDARAKMGGQTVRNIQKPIEASRRRLPAGSQTDTPAGDATIPTAEAKAGKTWLPLLDQELSAVSLPDLRSLERRVALIDGLLSNFSPILKGGGVTWKDSSQKSESQ